jgi:hypothetical protein
MNDPGFFDAARGLGKRMLAREGDARARAEYGFRCAVSRRPDAGELDVLIRVYDQERARFLRDPAAAKAVLKSELAPAELAAWTMVANVLLNLDETITKE